MSTSISSSATVSEPFPRGARRLPRLGVTAALAFSLSLACARGAAAYETDQYSNRLVPIADAAPELDRVMNEALARIASRWRRTEDRERFAFELYQEVGGLHWVDRIERHAMKSPAVEKLPQYRWHSVFRGAPIWASRVGFVFGVGATIRVGDTLLGTDKLGHFISQGLKYFKSHLAGWSEERVAGRGRFNERWLFGQATTSVFSNADLVANWEGYRFYRSLFEDGIVAGKPAIVRFGSGGAAIVRPFAWRDHVNDYWDEALNPSYMSSGLSRFMTERLATLCGDYRDAPERFVAADESELAARYAPIGIRPRPDLRLDHLCAGPDATASVGGRPELTAH